MLSVTGAIEAVRVGEEGRGFATVSADIRELARQAAGSADRVKDIVRDLQRQALVVRAELLRNIEAGEAEAATLQSLHARLTGVEGDMQQVVAGAAEIRDGAASILISARQVAQGAQEIAAAAEEAARSAQQSAAAARQQAQAAEALASVIEEIALLAQELQSAAPE
jgi:methyl-accepting chemotaxis protein